jgi:membrane protease YdiL (CAAX protease family)
MSSDLPTATRDGESRHFRLGRVLLFLCLTFFLTWGSDWVIDATAGYSAFFGSGFTPWGMLAPAFVALALRIFVFKDSPIHVSGLKSKARWILLGYMALVPVYGGIVALFLCFPGSGRLLQGIGALVLTLWTLWVIFVGTRAGSQSMSRAGLRLGDVKKGQLFVVAVVVFLLAQTVLNLAFGLGTIQARAGSVFGIPVPASLYVPALVLLFVPVAVIGIPLSGLAATFGEEYGWRGYLQDEMVKIGVLPGVLLVGLVWGLWHFPVILRGVHTYPPSWAGLSLGIALFVLWGIVQSYAVLKTRSIWIAAFMHGVVNSVYGFLTSYVSRASDRVFSFGLGLFGLFCLAAVVALILRDPLWRSGPADR